MLAWLNGILVRDGQRETCSFFGETADRSDYRVAAGAGVTAAAAGPAWLVGLGLRLAAYLTGPASHPARARDHRLVELARGRRPVVLAKSPGAAPEHRLPGRGRSGVLAAEAGARSAQRSVIARRHDDRGTGEQHPVVGGPGDGERAARDVDAVGDVLTLPRRTVVVGDGRGHHHRAGAGAAGAGLAGAALVDPHRDVPVAAAYDELDVDAVGVDRGVVGRRLEAAGRRRRGSRRRRPRAGCPCRRGGPARCARRPRPSVSPSSFGRAHVDGDQVAVDGEGLDAVAGVDRGSAPSRRRGRASTR